MSEPDGAAGSVGPGSVGPGALRSFWTQLLLEGLASGGATHVVLSPGSRNTPLTIAFAKDARFTCHSVIDERAAGFFGLGLARELGSPVVLCCTSGSAGAHYLPALIEAQASCIPLVVLTADRPVELQASGAEQTIDQTRMFGTFVTEGPPLPEPLADDNKLRAVMQQAARAVYAALCPVPGPVHVNVPVAKPLEPSPAQTEEERRWQEKVDAWIRRGPTRLSSAARGAASCEAWVRALAEQDRPWIITLGPCSYQEAIIARALAAQWRVPLLAEFAQAGPAAPLQALIDDWQREVGTGPARVLHIGPPAVSATWTGFSAEAAPELWLLPGARLRDPDSSAHAVLLGDVQAIVRDWLHLLAPVPSAKCCAFYQTLEERAQGLCERLRFEFATGNGPLTDVEAMHALLAGSTQGVTVVLGNSLPVRNAALVSPLLHGPRRFITTRGVNGIDGTLAAASGTCRAHRRPTLVLLGDVTAAHDLSSLALLSKCPAPVVVCVLDNGGGRIFDQLPAAALYGKDEELWKLWTTPPAIDWAAAACAYGLAFAEAQQVPELTAALAQLNGRQERPLLVHCKTVGGSLEFRRRWAESRRS